MEYLEVIRYLGYKSNPSKETEEKILKSIEEVKQISNPKKIYGVYNIKKEGRIQIENSHLYLEGDDIKKLLEHSDIVAILAVTLGLELENRLKYYEKFDLFNALIFNASANMYIEQICDEVELEIKESAKERGLYITRRFSPGYGDLPLNTQVTISKLLNINKIGISLTEDNILIPRKSVTAILGFQSVNIHENHKCLHCSKVECEYRKDGNISD